MSLDDAGMHRAGLAFLYRIIPVLVATILYGMIFLLFIMRTSSTNPGLYIAILCVATRGLW